MSDLLAFARELTALAADIQRRRLGNPGAIARKKGAGLVTDADRACEEAIVARIRQEYPEHAIVAEEGSGTAPAAGIPEHCWYVDPIDGTTNFAHGFPIFAVSVGYAQSGRIEAAACRVPMLGEEYWASREGGAFLNGNRLAVTEREGLKDAFLATSSPFDPAKDLGANVAVFSGIARRSVAVRQAGCAVFDLCSVAAGRFDAVWDYKLRSWDTAAASLIIEEAGGRFTDLQGNPWHPDARAVIASNGRVHDALLAALQG